MKLNCIADGMLKGLDAGHGLKSTDISIFDIFYDMMQFSSCSPRFALQFGCSNSTLPVNENGTNQASLLGQEQWRSLRHEASLTQDADPLSL